MPLPQFVGFTIWLWRYGGKEVAVCGGVKMETSKNVIPFYNGGLLVATNYEQNKLLWCPTILFNNLSSVFRRTELRLCC